MTDEVHEVRDRLCWRSLLRLDLRQIHQLEDGQRGKAAQG